VRIISTFRAIPIPVSHPVMSTATHARIILLISEPMKPIRLSPPEAIVKQPAIMGFGVFTICYALRPIIATVYRKEYRAIQFVPGTAERCVVAVYS